MLSICDFKTSIIWRMESDRQLHNHEQRQAACPYACLRIWILSLGVEYHVVFQASCISSQKLWCSNVVTKWYWLILSHLRGFRRLLYEFSKIFRFWLHCPAYILTLVCQNIFMASLTPRYAIKICKLLG